LKFRYSTLDLVSFVSKFVLFSSAHFIPFFSFSISLHFETKKSFGNW
jgi:hypothetical protein